MRYTNIIGAFITFLGGLALTYFTAPGLMAWVALSFEDEALLLVQGGMGIIYLMIMVFIPISIAVQDEDKEIA